MPRSHGVAIASGPRVEVVVSSKWLPFFMSGARVVDFPCNEQEGFRANNYPLCDQSLSDGMRVENFVERLTTIEKIRLLVDNTTRLAKALAHHQLYSE